MANGAEVYNLADASIDGDAINYGAGTMLTPSGFVPVNDTFNGQVIFTVTLQSITGNLAGSGAINFTLYDSNQNRILAVGNHWFSGNWGFWKAIGDPNATFDLLHDDSSTDVIDVGESKTLIITLDFIAGGNDSGTIQFSGDTVSTAIPAGDYSFAELMAGGAGQANFSNMTMEVIAGSSGGGGGGGGDPWDGEEGVFDLPDASIDANWYTSYRSGPDLTPSGFPGVDNTFNGQVIFTITLDCQASSLANLAATGAINFTLYNGETRVLAVGNSWNSPNWSFWKAAGNPSAEVDILDDSSQGVQIGDGSSSVASKTLVITMDFVAGASDSGTIRFADGTMETPIPPADYSFTELMAGGGGAPTNFSNMSMEIISSGGDSPSIWDDYDVDAYGDVDTGSWMGLVNVTYDPYIWNYDLGCWMLLASGSASVDGAWFYIFN